MSENLGSAPSEQKQVEPNLGLKATESANSTFNPGTDASLLTRPHVPFFKALFHLRFSDMSIVHRLYLCVGITFLLFFASTFVVFFMAQAQISDNGNMGLSAVQRSATNLSNDIIKLEDKVRILVSGKKSNATAESDARSLTENLRRDVADLNSKINSLNDDQIKQRLSNARLASYYSSLETGIYNLLRVYADDNVQATQFAYELSASGSLPLLSELRNIASIVATINLAHQNDNAVVMRWIQISLLCGLAIALCVILLTNITIRHSLRHDTGLLLKRLLAMAQGDLRTKVEIKAQDEIGTIGRLVDNVVDNTNNTLSLVKSDVDKLYDMVNTNRKSIDATNDAISVQRNTAQSVAEATSLMESSVEKVTEFAKSTLKEVQVAEQASDTCRRTMQDNITTTHTLSDRLHASSEAINKIHMMSSQIEAIVKTIADIADQTNLLALNATIESARAGESGRGFAIVADEIRELAIKTAKSTKEVSNTISLLETAVTNSVEVMASCEGEMDNSLQQSSRANSSIEEIMGIIATISDMSEQIVQSCQQQFSSASEINSSIAHISKLAEDSYDQMAELQTNMHALNDLATNQATVLGKFKLD